MLTVAFARNASADDAELDLATAHADEVSFDARKKEIELRGHVTVDAAPFHLRASELVVRRGPLGIDVVGKGELSFCACAHAPLTVGFDAARVAPPGDIFIDHPTLKVSDTTVLALPWFWLRSPARPGILPPEIEYRGKESMLLGAGVHVPWSSAGATREPWPKSELPPDRLLEIYSAGYVLGGARVRARVLTPQSDLTVTWDDFQGNQGVAIDARGSVAKDDVSATWDVDALRGARAVNATTELSAAAAPYDRARAETRMQEGPALVGVGAIADSRRGTFDLGAFGPRAFVRASGAMLSRIPWTLTADGGALSGTDVHALTGELTGLGYFHGIGDLGGALSLGPVDASVGLRAEHMLFSDDHQDRDDVARARFALPVGRTFGDPADPVMHRLEPRVSAAAMSLDLRDAFLLSPVNGEAWTVDAGVATAVGRYAHRDGAEVEASVAHVGGDFSPVDVARWRASASGDLIGVGAEGAHEIANERASALRAQLRLGALDRFHGGVSIAGRAGIDPVAARVVFDRTAESFGGFSAAEGWTAGARVAIPVVRPLTIATFGDYDATSRVLLDVGGSASLRDACGCVTLRLTASHRVAREGVDAALTLVLTPK